MTSVWSPFLRRYTGMSETAHDLPEITQQTGGRAAVPTEMCPVPRSLVPAASLGIMPQSITPGRAGSRLLHGTRSIASGASKSSLWLRASYSASQNLSIQVQNMKTTRCQLIERIKRDNMWKTPVAPTTEARKEGGARSSRVSSFPSISLSYPFCTMGLIQPPCYETLMSEYVARADTFAQ